MDMVPSIRLMCAATALCLAGTTAVPAQSWPSQPITVVVSTTAGASPDIIARIFAQHLSEAVKQPVIVENRGGANGQIAVGVVARAPADGYTFLVTTAATLSTNPSLYPKNGSIAVTELRPVTKLVDLDFVISARPTLGINSARGLVSKAKAEPGKLNAATTARGSAAYLTAELFKQASSTDFMTIVHNGGGQAINAVLSNQVDLLFETVALSEPLIAAGKLIPLATTGAKRSAFLPKVPTVKEEGIEGFEVTGWVALVAPKGVPDAIVERVYSELKKIVEQPEVRKRLETLKAQPVVNSPAQFGDEWAKERAMWDHVIKKAGITLE